METSLESNLPKIWLLKKVKSSYRENLGSREDFFKYKRTLSMCKLRWEGASPGPC